MASNKHAQIRYKVLDDCFSNFRRKFYFNDLMERCNEALRELYGSDHSGIKTRTLRSDINYIRTRATEAGVEVEAIDDGNGYYYRYSEPDFSIFKRGLGEDDLAQLSDEEETFVKRYLKENGYFPYWAFEFDLPKMFDRLMEAHMDAIVAYVNEKIVAPGETPFTKETVDWECVPCDFDWPEGFLES